jgi:hypothetical protein
MPKLKLRNPFKKKTKKVTPNLRSVKKLVRTSEKRRMQLYKKLTAIEKQNEKLNLSLKRSMEKYIKSQTRKSKSNKTHKKRR